VTGPVFDELRQALSRPAPWERVTTEILWTDEHISARMLDFHLNPDVTPASRPPEMIDRSVAWIEERVGLRGRRVIDLGCGPGLYTTRFARAGARVTGVDFSSRSLAHARRVAGDEGLAIDYVQADYRAWVPQGSADLVTLIYCDYCALPPADRASLLRRIRDCLADDGALLFDVVAPAAFANKEESTLVAEDLMDGFWAPSPYVGLLRSFRYDDLRLGLDRYTICTPERTFEVCNWLQYFDVGALTAELGAAGLRVVSTHGDVAGAPFDADAEEFAVIAAAD
jgi:SAM-dependent methyltransferase